MNYANNISWYFAYEKFNMNLLKNLKFYFYEF